MGKITTIICDSCGDDANNAFETVQIPCHHWSFRDFPVYEDRNMNKVSGRIDEIYLCRPCYNLAWSAFVQAVKTDDKS